jgi:hypothetical protein
LLLDDECLHWTTPLMDRRSLAAARAGYHGRTATSGQRPRSRGAYLRNGFVHAAWLALDSIQENIARSRACDRPCHTCMSQSRSWRDELDSSI